MRSLVPCLLAISPVVCFLISSPPRASITLPSKTTRRKSIQMVSSTPRKIAWPDEQPTPAVDQPAKARIVAVAPKEIKSPFKDRGNHADWFEVWSHIAKRVRWADTGVDMQVFDAESLRPGGVGDEAPEHARFRDAADQADIFVASAVHDASTSEWISAVLEDAQIGTRFAVECAPSLDEASVVGGFRPTTDTPLLRSLPGFLRDWIDGSDASRDRKLWDTLMTFYSRNSSEDLTFLTLVLVNTYVASVPRVTGIAKESGSETLTCMLDNCKQQVIDCAKDPKCRSCIACLNNCPPNDQVCAYRCITSYETATMEAFSLCVLQRHNCMCNAAEIPLLPDPAPLASFRGAPLTHKVAEDLFIGWLSKEAFSWKVVCGQNPAYDFFPSQHQIFYRAQGKGQMWYDPVFKVVTVDGEEVWRRRHYRVKTAMKPGTFRFSVLDNGVVSNEYWRIVDVADDLSWGVFYYAGAATVAGQSYTGALLVSRDGGWPREQAIDRIERAFDTCGIKMWELCEVDNSNSAGAPLGLPKTYSISNNRPLV